MGQPSGLSGDFQSHLGQVSGRGSHPMPGGVLTSQDAGPGRGTDRARIGIRKGHAPFGEALDIGRLVQGRLAVKSGIRPAQVIGQYEN